MMNVSGHDQHTSLPTRALLELAAVMLPTAHRQRFRLEFAAELHDVPSRERFGYALSVLIHAPALRSALSGSFAAAPARVRRQRRPLRCRLGRHRWHVASAEDGSRYEQCMRCGKDRYDGPDREGNDRYLKGFTGVWMS